MFKINADDHEASHETTNAEDESSEYAYADAYAGSYDNDYAQWTPELYQKHGLPQNYYQSDNIKRTEGYIGHGVFGQAPRPSCRQGGPCFGGPGQGGPGLGGPGQGISNIMREMIAGDKAVSFSFNNFRYTLIDSICDMLLKESLKISRSS